jgi:hypothetical protein
VAVKRDGPAASLRGFGKGWSARLPAGASASSPTGRSPESSPEAPAHLRSAQQPRCGKTSGLRAPVPLRALLDTPPGDEIRLVWLPRLMGSCGLTGGYFCRRFAPYRFGSFCFPGVENYSTGWIVEGSSFLISLQMKSSISMSER